MTEHRRIEILKALLKYSFTEIGWEYGQLTESEQAILTEEEFAQLKEWATLTD